MSDPLSTQSTRGRWDRMSTVEQFDYVVGLEAEIARLRGALEEIVQPWTGDVEGYEIAREALGLDD